MTTTLDDYFKLPASDLISPVDEPVAPQSDFLSFDVRNAYKSGNTYLRDGINQAKKGPAMSNKISPKDTKLKN